MDERTLRPGELRDAATLRPSHIFAGTALGGGSVPRQAIGGWSLVREIESRAHCTLYLAENSSQEKAVLKLYNAPLDNLPSMKKVSRLQDSRLLPILELGEHEGKPYEVSPYMQDGSLDGQILPDDVVMRVVIPQLTHALDVLHRNQLLHNDVKPSNLFWVRKNEEIALGDFDVLSPMKPGKAAGPCGTREYMAPEVLFGGSGEAGAASDFCSMGLTLIALLTGASPLHGKTEIQQRRAWMGGRLIPDGMSAKLGTLINGLIDYEPGSRTTADGVHRWMKTYKITDTESELPQKKPVPVKRPGIQPVWFGEYPICDIPDLIEKSGKNWNLACFMLKQKRLSSFLRQFDLRYYELCIECEKAFDQSEGLFRLLHTLSCSRDFYWYGEHFDDLEDFVARMLDTENTAPGGTGAHFLRANMLGLYLTNLRSPQEAIDQAQRFAFIAQHHPELAMTQLYTSMGARPELRWKDQLFHSLADAANWLVRAEGSLDGHVRELCESRRFEAWLSFIGEGAFLNDVENEMKGITL